MSDKFWRFIISDFKGAGYSFICWREPENSTTLNFSDWCRAKAVINYLQNFEVENQILLRSYSSVSFLIRKQSIRIITSMWIFSCIEVVQFTSVAIGWFMLDKFWWLIISDFTGVGYSIIRWRWSQNSTALTFTDWPKATAVIDRFQESGVENDALTITSKLFWMVCNDCSFPGTFLFFVFVYVDLQCLEFESLLGNQARSLLEMTEIMFIIFTEADPDLLAEIKHS